MNRSRGLLVAAVAGGALVASCSGGGTDASDYPSRNINMIVPIPAGSSTDVSTRFVVDCLERELDTTIVVENREGGGGAVGLGEFARSKADGYTLTSTAVGNALVPPIEEGNVGYDADSFLPIGMIGQAPIVLVVAPDSPHQSADELLKAATSNGIKVGVPSALSVPGISLSALAEKYNLDIELVPFEGNANTVQGVVSGEVDAGYMSADGGVTLPRIESGDLVALATAVDEPPTWAPDLPTLNSLGYEDLPNGDSFWFLAAQPGTPDDVVSVLEDATNTCMSDDDVKQKIGENVAPDEFIPGDDVAEMLSKAAEGYESALD